MVAQRNNVQVKELKWSKAEENPMIISHSRGQIKHMLEKTKLSNTSTLLRSHMTCNCYLTLVFLSPLKCWIINRKTKRFWFVTKAGSRVVVQGALLARARKKSKKIREEALSALKCVSVRTLTLWSNVIRLFHFHNKNGFKGAKWWKSDRFAAFVPLWALFLFGYSMVTLTWTS